MAKTRPRYTSGPKKGKFMSNRAIAAKKAARKRTTKKKPKAAPRRGKSTNMAKKKKRNRSQGRRRSGGTGISKNEVKDLMIGGAIYGFITEPDVDSGDFQATIQSTLAKVPEIGNRDISNGLALWALDKYGFSNKYIRMAAKAALVNGATRFGRRGFKLGGVDAQELGGWDDAIDVTEQGETVSGVID